MKAVFWILKLVFFLFALTFAVKNTDMVTVRYYLGVEWQAPLIFVLVVVFCLGVAAGVIAGLGHVVQLRREVSRLRKQTPPAPPHDGAAPSALSSITAPSRVPNVV